MGDAGLSDDEDEAFLGALDQLAGDLAPEEHEADPVDLADAHDAPGDGVPFLYLDEESDGEDFERRMDLLANPEPLVRQERRGAAGGKRMREGKRKKAKATK